MKTRVILPNPKSKKKNGNVKRSGNKKENCSIAPVDYPYTGASMVHASACSFVLSATRST
ncbi:hypothetical protein [Aneurinibacillus aneurinilyticus]|uniref:Uncharacterized protein n=1 Tax=Aneurinibacillus aneurinilyticus TaxID=1391 RepID=A0A848CN66_ANEAE|nr:hypothetical protein [Aneurinibacillus aneurinilyticus]NME97303.1 hypothetical protein [Aneurinibacillus aneurinilyticus]